MFFKKLKFRIVIFIVCILGMFSNVYSVSYMYPINKNKDVKVSSINTIAANPEFTFQSEAQVLMEPTTGEILYANNENEKLLPASVTKIMTLLLTMEQIDSGKMAYEDKVKCSAKASHMGGSQIWFKENEELTVDECLKAICVVSANDVTVAMAEKIGGSEENFVKMMNDKAVELGMENTCFKNSHGIDEEGHYSSAKDIALMSRELITKHPDILKYTSIWQDTLRNGEFGLNSTNKLIRFYEGATGLKTGSTSQALFNLSGTATRNGTSFIAVVMRAPSSDIRLQEVKQLLDYGFANYEIKNICENGVKAENISVNKNIGKTYETKIKDDVSVLVNKGEKIDMIDKITYNENITAPLKNGDTVGRIEIFNSNTNEKLGESDLIVINDVEKSSFIDYLKYAFKIFIIKNVVVE